MRLLEIYVPKADTLAIDRVDEGSVLHLHFLWLHGAGCPRVPAEVVGTAVRVKPGHREAQPLSHHPRNWTGEATQGTVVQAQAVLK